MDEASSLISAGYIGNRTDRFTSKIDETRQGKQWRSADVKGPRCLDIDTTSLLACSFQTPASPVRFRSELRSRCQDRAATNVCAQNETEYDSKTLEFSKCVETNRNDRIIA